MGNSETIRPSVGDLLGQLAVLRRIDLVDAAAEHGDRVAAGLQHRPVRRRIDAPRHAAGDGQPGVPPDPWPRRVAAATPP